MTPMTQGRSARKFEKSTFWKSARGNFGTGQLQLLMDKNSSGSRSADGLRAVHQATCSRRPTATLRAHSYRSSQSAGQRKAKAAGRSHKPSAVRSSQAAEQLSQSATWCSPCLTKQLPAGRTGGFLAARAPYATVSVCVREGAATRRGLHCSHEPHCTSFWTAACPMSWSGCYGAPPSRALRDQIGWRARRAFAIYDFRPKCYASLRQKAALHEVIKRVSNFF